MISMGEIIPRSSVCFRLYNHDGFDGKNYEALDVICPKGPQFAPLLAYHPEQRT